jgi:uncharacterized membrane protein YfcA
MSPLEDAALILVGFAVGTLSGALGVGGGILLVPTLLLAFHLDQHTAQGTSLAAIIPTSIVGGFTHLRRRNVYLAAGLAMGSAGVVGALIGSSAALRIDNKPLARIFGIVMLYAAYRMLPRRPAPGPEAAAQE